MLRDIPVFTFINKMDRDSRDPFELLEEIEKILGISTYPINWPIGSGKSFQGVYDREAGRIIKFTAKNGQHEVDAVSMSVDDPALKDMLGDEPYQTLSDDIELLDGAGYEQDMDLVQRGKQSPVFFGSALTNFGVEPFLEAFLKMTPPPLSR